MKSVSIIIPAYNESLYIGSCLESIKKLDYPENLIEVIVVDNGSTDNTRDIVKSSSYTVLTYPDVNVSELRNIGAARAKGDIFSFLDADCLVPENWLQNINKFLDDPKIGIVGCSRFLLPDRCSWVEQTWKSQKKETEGYVKWVGSGNLSIKKDNFKKIGGFNKSLVTSEDWELCFRVKKKLNLNTYSSLDVSVIHCKCRETLLDFFKKELWHGRDVLMPNYYLKLKLFENKALLLALFYLICIIGVIASILLLIIYGNYIPLVGLILSLFLFSLLLSIKFSYVRKKILGLTLLYIIYGIARAFALINVNIVRNLRMQKNSNL